jgi:hypothetical protein
MHDQGDMAGARLMQEAVLQKWQQLMGDDHPHTLTSMNNLATTMQQQGDLAGARLLQEAVLQKRQLLLGDDHPDTLICVCHLASTLAMQGDYISGGKLAAELRLRLIGHADPGNLQPEVEALIHFMDTQSKRRASWLPGGWNVWPIWCGVAVALVAVAATAYIRVRTTLIAKSFSAWQTTMFQLSMHMLSMCVARHMCIVHQENVCSPIMPLWWGFLRCFAL